MADSGNENVLPFRLDAAYADKRVGDVDVATLIKLLSTVVTERVEAEVRPLREEIGRLRNSLKSLGEHVERVKIGGLEDASLVVTDRPDADVSLARAKISHEERYPLSAVDIAARIPGAPTPYRVATVIDGLGLKGNSTYWCALKHGKTTFNRYSEAAVEKVQEAFRNPAAVLAEDSPAFRTIINFLEGL